MQTVQPESVGFSSQRLERINQAMQGYIDRRQFGGIITLVARKGQVAHLEKFGWQEIESNRPMAFDTIFRIYSMTKPITSTAADDAGRGRQGAPGGPGCAVYPGFQRRQGDGGARRRRITTWWRRSARCGCTTCSPIPPG